MQNDKREQYLSWNGYFMGIAFLSALRSKDPSTRNGACIVNADKKVVSTGYNGFPIGCSDNNYPWTRDGNDNKYLYVVHAELNAILNAHSSVKECVIFIYSEKGYYPCSECAKSIIQSGIKTVVLSFAIKDNTDKYNWDITLRMFRSAGVSCMVMLEEEWMRDVNFLKNEIDTIKVPKNISI